ncbi:MAG: hypothetical protein ACC707_13595 [Thiohalomonadales bacterium]
MIKLRMTRLLFLLNFVLASTNLHAAQFDAIVAPSLMDSGMDGWYKIPPNSGPHVHRAHSIYQDQGFSLLIFFRGYTADKDNIVHVMYDVQVYDPQGKPTDDKGSNLLAYKGPMGNPNALMLNRQYLKIVFTEKYPPGNYRIKVTAYDKINNESFTSEAQIELVPFAFPDKFSSQKETGEWMMKYYINPTPINAIGALQDSMKLDPEWLNENLSILSFFKTIYKDNPFLLKNIAKQFSSFSIEDQKKFLLIASLMGDTRFLLEDISSFSDDLTDFLLEIAEISIPEVNDEINSAVQLDILWSEFLATGKYEPIRKIVSSLALYKHKGTLDKIKSGEIIKVTEDIKTKAYLEATYQSAVWSLKSNIKQMPLVLKYCTFIYQNEKLDADIKSQLGSIIQIAQSEIRKE